MSLLNLTENQKSVIEGEGALFLSGPVGTGKTTALEHRFVRLVQNEDGASDATLVLLADRAQVSHFTSSPHLTEAGLGETDQSISTFYQYARRTVAFYRTYLAEKIGYFEPYSPPTWLTYDMAQLVMWELVNPMLQDGYFADLRLRPQQIVSQLLDILNRSAFNRLPFEAGLEKQQESWGGDDVHRRQLKDAELAVKRFRNRCLQLNLVDTSLMLTMFDIFLRDQPLFESHTADLKHILIDNLEEQTGLGQAFIEKLMTQTDSAVAVFDKGGGYKRLLAANPDFATRFEYLAERQIALDYQFVVDSELSHLAERVKLYLQGGEGRFLESAPAVEHLILDVVKSRYRRDMLARLGPALARLLEQEDLEPRDVAILVPYLDGALKFKLAQSLEEAGLPYQFIRRRETPRENRYVRAWLTWFQLAHWGETSPPSLFDVSEALTISVHGLDPVRAAILAGQIYDPVEGLIRLPREMEPETVARIGHDMVDLADVLIEWVRDYVVSDLPDREEIDFFFYYLFDQILTRPDYFLTGSVRSHAAAVADWLIRMASRIKELVPAQTEGEVARSVGDLFVNGIYNGLVTADPPASGTSDTDDGIFIGSLQAFLLDEQEVAVQVWLETASSGWWDLPRQPLSNPFVLNSQWKSGDIWTLEDDVRMRDQLLTNIITGLCGRCKRGVVLAMSELDRRGQRQDGPLWRALI